MKKNHILAALIVTGALAPAVHARDTIVNIPLADVLELPEAKEKLDGSVKFYLHGAPTPKILKRFSTDVTNKKTNGVGKSDEFGCKWAALSGLIALQESAKREGANAVVDIVSYYKKHERKDPVTIECHAGAVIIGVALKGTYAKIGK